MIVGIPGAGIGGLFYLLGALWMPLHQVLFRSRRDRPPARGLLMRQVVIGLGIMAGIWVAGWLLGIVLIPDPSPSAAVGATPLPVAANTRNLWRFGMLGAALVTLGGVLLSVQVLTLLFGPGRSRPAGALPAASESSRLEGTKVERRLAKERTSEG